MWTIIPTNTPLVIRHCSKCGRTKEFYCSEKFRLNGRHTKIDIWLIYKCTKCDTTWKSTIKRGIKPHDLPQHIFDKFTNNDKKLAWKYAFDRQLLKQNECEILYSDVKYDVEGFNEKDFENPLQIRVNSVYMFELKLSTFLAGRLSISVNKLKKLVQSGCVKTTPEYDIMKYRIRADIDVIFDKDNYFI